MTGLFLCASPGFAKEQTLLARVTVYWHNDGKQQQACSNGTRLRNGHCAVDPHKIPYGSKVLFPDGPCIAVDTGPAVVNRKAARLAGRTSEQRSALVVDRYFENRKDALAWADTHPHFMTLQVVTPESRSKSTHLARPGREQNLKESCSLPVIDPPPRAAASNEDPLRQSWSKSTTALSPADVRGSLVPTFLGASLPRS